MEAIHEIAHRYIDMGFAPVPVQFKSKVCKLRDWPKLKLKHEDVSGIFCDLPCNIGIVLGQLSEGLVDIDLDCEEAMVLAPHMLPTTGMIFGRESKPQSHWLYKSKNGGKSLSFADADGHTRLEVRANGSMTVFPGSIHQSGEEVRFDHQAEPHEIEYDQLVLSAKHLAAGSLVYPHWRERQRHHLALALSGTLLAGGISREDATRFFDALINATRDEEAEDRYRCIASTARRLTFGGPVSGKIELAKMIGEDQADRFCDWLGLRSQNNRSSLHCRAVSIIKAADVEPVPESDTANAERFTALNRDKARYSHDLKKWFVWDGRRWAPDRDGEVDRLASSTARVLALNAADESDKAALGWAAKSHDLNRLRSMIALAQSRCSVRSEAFDADPWKLNCESGIIDLKTGEQAAHDPAALMRRLAPVRHDPSAECSTFLGFLNRIFEGDEELIGFLKRATGYSLTGTTGEQCLFVLVGHGANGKSTLIRVIQDLLGDYAQQTPMDTLMTSRSGTIPNDIARLEGARFVSAVEAEAGQRLAEAKIKQLTGGDRISARFLHGEFFEFTPHFKLWLATNKLPEVRGTDEGIWRRFKVIPFNVTIPEAERDRELPDKLKSELPGILNWAIEGCLDWQKGGLRPPEKVRNATKAYRLDMDLVARFIEDCCVRDLAADETVKNLFAAYCRWCEVNGEQSLPKRAFGLRLQEMGFGEARSGMARKRRGIRLKSEVELLANELTVNEPDTAPIEDLAWPRDGSVEELA